MIRAISVVVADSSEDFRELLSEAIEAEADMRLAGAVGSGMEAEARVRELRPDVLVTNLLLEEREGLSVLRDLKESGEMPRTIVVSGFFNDKLAGVAGALGVERFITKPCSISSILECIRECSLSEEERDEWRRRISRIIDTEKRVDEALNECGFMPHLLGCRYLREALITVSEDRDKLRGVNKVLYPELAKLFGTDGTNVERCIRNAISSAWREGDEKKRMEYLGAAGARSARPGNLSFMKIILTRMDGSEKAERHGEEA